MNEACLSVTNFIHQVRTKYRAGLVLIHLEFIGLSKVAIDVAMMDDCILWVTGCWRVEILDNIIDQPLQYNIVFLVSFDVLRLYCKNVATILMFERNFCHFESFFYHLLLHLIATVMYMGIQWSTDRIIHFGLQFYCITALMTTV